MQPLQGELAIVIDAGQSEGTRVEAVLSSLLPSCQGKGADERQLFDAMRYAVRGGKRLRARLVYAAGELSGAESDVLDRLAAAVELVHAFSLVHDDLPALDDDALRRGEPSLHARFGEATAILAGDALLAFAFEVASEAADDPVKALRSVRLLARATGAAGMVGGQMLDIAGESRALSADELERMHRLKSGALIHAAVMLGADAGALPPADMAALDGFGQDIGLAFQIQDDVLDATVATAQLGKPHGSDVQRGKSTYVRLLGVSAAKQAAEQRLESALRHLAPFGARADRLAALATAMVRRER